jgi:hypothetical protein
VSHRGLSYFSIFFVLFSYSRSTSCSALFISSATTSYFHFISFPVTFYIISLILSVTSLSSCLLGFYSLSFDVQYLLILFPHISRLCIGVFPIAVLFFVLSCVTFWLFCHVLSRSLLDYESLHFVLVFCLNPLFIFSPFHPELYAF